MTTAVATISVDLDPVDSHLRGYGHADVAPDPTVREVALPRLLEIFARHDVRATLFVLASEAERDPRSFVDAIAAGHEVASHGIDHEPGLDRRPPGAIAQEVADSRARIAGAVGHDVIGFRAPDWSAGRRLVPALADAGYRYDASLVPSPVMTAGHLLLAVKARSPRAVMALRLPASLRRLPFRWTVDSRTIVEFPLAVSPRTRYPIYHTLRPRMSDATFDHHLDGFARSGTSLSYALHGVDALGLEHDDVDARLAGHPGMDMPLATKLDLLDRTVAAIAARFPVRPFAERLDADDVAGDRR